MLRQCTSPFTRDVCERSSWGSSRRKSVSRYSGKMDKVFSARVAASLVASTMPCESISCADAKATLQASATFWMRGAIDSRSSGVICLESRTPAKVRVRCVLSLGRITAPTATGPASAPRPTSSKPAMNLKWGQRRFSNFRSGFAIIKPKPCIAADDKQINEHAPRVAQDAHFAVSIEIPVDGDLNDPVTMQVGNIKQLDVESPAFESL